MTSELTLHFYPANNKGAQVRDDDLVLEEDIMAEQKLCSITLIYDKENFHILIDENAYFLCEVGTFQANSLIIKAEQANKQNVIDQQVADEHLLELLHIDNDYFLESSKEHNNEVHVSDNSTELTFLAFNDPNSYWDVKNQSKTMVEKEKDKTIKNISLLTEYYAGPKFKNECEK